MPRNCQVCESKDRYRVEFALARRVSVKVLAKRYALHPDAIYRHRLAHVPKSVLQDLRKKADMPEQELEKLRIEESGGLLEHLVVQRARLYKLADSCEDMGDYPHAIAAHTRITANLELTGKLLDVFASHAPIHQNITISADYLRLRQLMLAALKPFPEARRAIVEVLRGAETPMPSATNSVQLLEAAVEATAGNNPTEEDAQYGEDHQDG